MYSERFLHVGYEKRFRKSIFYFLFLFNEIGCSNQKATVLGKYICFIKNKK